MARMAGASGRPRVASSQWSSPEAIRERPDLIGRPGAVSPARPTYTKDVRCAVMVRSSGRRIALPRVLRQQGEVQIVSRRADRDLEVAERVHPRVIAGL